MRGAAPYSILPADGSLYVMKEGCQERYKHRVPTARGSGGRFALSFRMTSKSNEAPAPPTRPQPSQTPVPLQPASPLQPESVPLLPASPVQDQEVSVLLGTSLTKWIPSGPGFVNLSTSGARLVSPHPDWKGKTALEMLKEFKDREPSVGVVKVIIAFGTNDLRYLRERRGIHRP